MSIEDILARRIEESERTTAALKARQEEVAKKKLAKVLKGQRANDTRRKVLAGALVLDMMEKDQEAKQRFLARLDAYLTRQDDRRLFDLPAKEVKTKTSGQREPQA